ncbi:MAG: hypothetical protein AAFX65_08200 [Cyanobacteria bacterium J06638_7]
MARRSRFSGAAATVAALAGGAVGFCVALFLRSLVLNTPAEAQPGTFYWWFVLLSAAGALWGLATQSMKQLEQLQGYRPSAFKQSRSPESGGTPPDSSPGQSQPRPPQR